MCWRNLLGWGIFEISAMPGQAGVIGAGMSFGTALASFTSWRNGALVQADDSIDWMVRPTHNVPPSRLIELPSLPNPFPSPSWVGESLLPSNATLEGPGIHHFTSKHLPQEPAATQDKMNQDAASKSHPLGPLTGAEIIQASDLVKKCWGKTALQFKVITLQEPLKTELIPYLAAERAGQPTPRIDRRAFVVYYFRGTVGSPMSPPKHNSGPDTGNAM